MRQVAEVVKRRDDAHGANAFSDVIAINGARAVDAVNDNRIKHRGVAAGGGRPKDCRLRNRIDAINHVKKTLNAGGGVGLMARAYVGVGSRLGERGHVGGRRHLAARGQRVNVKHRQRLRLVCCADPHNFLRLRLRVRGVRFRVGVCRQISAAGNFVPALATGKPPLLRVVREHVRKSGSLPPPVVGVRGREAHVGALVRVVVVQRVADGIVARLERHRAVVEARLVFRVVPRAVADADGAVDERAVAVWVDRLHNDSVEAAAVQSLIDGDIGDADAHAVRLGVLVLVVVLVLLVAQHAVALEVEGVGCAVRGRMEDVVVVDPLRFFVMGLFLLLSSAAAAAEGISTVVVIGVLLHDLRFAHSVPVANRLIGFPHARPRGPQRGEATGGGLRQHHELHQAVDFAPPHQIVE